MIFTSPAGALSGNHPGVTMTPFEPGPLVPGSPAASTLLRLWSGEPDVDYPRGPRRDWLTLPVQVAALWGRLSGNPPGVLFVCPTIHSALRVEQQLTHIVGDAPREPFDWFEIPNRSGRGRSSLAEFRVGTRAGGHWEDRSPDIVVPHPWLSRRRLRAAMGIWPTIQLLAVKRHPALHVTTLSRGAQGGFGPVPFEVMLAGSPQE